MSGHRLTFPDGFDRYEWEMEAKGWFSEATLSMSGTHYRLTFYDPVRLGQEIESEHRRGGVFFEPNLLVIPSVTRANMERAVEAVIASGREKSLTSE